jgi:hypothetical protein
MNIYTAYCFELNSLGVLQSSRRISRDGWESSKNTKISFLVFWLYEKGGNDVKFSRLLPSGFSFSFITTNFLIFLVQGVNYCGGGKGNGFLFYFIFLFRLLLLLLFSSLHTWNSLVSNFCFFPKRIWIYLKCKARFAPSDKTFFSNSFYAKFSLYDLKWKYRLISAWNVFVFSFVNWKVVKSTEFGLKPVQRWMYRR